jgi:RHS repeat-associated protein
MDATTVNQYLYDGEGRICAVSSTPVPGFTTMTGYVYDAEGNRVAKGTITSMSCDPSVNGLMTANNETDYVLGPGGEQVTELAQDANGTMNWQRTYVYAGGAIIATYEPNPDNQTQPLPSFRLTDWLGTLRATTDAYGVAQGTCTGLPYGDGVTCSGDIPDNHHFTGKERDAESGNDYFDARYYSSSMGRFMSPDWAAQEEPVPYAKMDDPQSLNLYVYVLNNPMTGIDKDGHECGGQAACRAKSEPGDQPGGQAPAQPQKYTGPEDPTNPGHPITENKQVKKELDNAWMKTSNGTARNGKAEAGFVVENRDGKISIEQKQDSIGSDKPNGLQFNTDKDTLLIVHTHGNAMDPTPSKGDRDPSVTVPDLVKSQFTKYMTIPNSATGNPPLNNYVEIK